MILYLHLQLKWWYFLTLRNLTATWEKHFKYWRSPLHRKKELLSPSSPQSSDIDGDRSPVWILRRRVSSTTLCSINSVEISHPATKDHLHTLWMYLWGLQSKTKNQLQDKKKALHDLSRRSTIILQWIPSHCGITGKEKADAPSKVGSQMKQSSHSVT